MRRYYGRPLDDPSNAPFRCDGYVDEGHIHDEQGTAIPLVELPPFLRALLVTDGTVTKALEAYFWEPVTVDTLEQRFETAQAAVSWIGVDAGDRCLVRDARLRGVHSGRAFAEALSLIRTELIPADFPPPTDRSRDRDRRPDPRQRPGELSGGVGRGDGPRRGRGRGRLPHLSDHHRRPPRDPDYRTLSAGLVCAVTQLLDTIRLNETPEGVDLGLRPAGPAVRSLAFALDTGIRLALYLVVALPLGIAGFGVGIILIGIFLLEWVYPVVFEVWTGATPGKRAMGLAVVHDDGTPVGLPASAIRNLLRTIDFLPIFYGVGLVSTLVDRDFRRLGDLAAGTLVIHSDRPADGHAGRREKDRAGGSAARSPTRATPPPGLPLATAQAILAFDERAGRLSPARRIELAETLLAHLPGNGGDAQAPSLGPAAVARVRGYAQWLAGGR